MADKCGSHGLVELMGLISFGLDSGAHGFLVVCSGLGNGYGRCACNGSQCL